LPVGRVRLPALGPGGVESGAQVAGALACSQEALGTVWFVTKGRAMIGRALRRVLVVGALTGVGAVGTASVALAETPDSWTKSAPMPLLEVLGIYVGIPVALFALIALLVVAPSLVRGANLQPGVEWSGQPEWFGARPDDEAIPTGDSTTDELSETKASAVTRGGAGGRW
jgi:hypothetical protein